jgi:FkbM family methyltransferase
VTRRPWLHRLGAWLPRRARTWGKRFVYGALPGVRGSFPYFGVQVFFPPGSHLFERVCEEGVFEPAMIAAIDSLVRPGTTYFDVGANIGLMSIPILASGKDCSVVSFEPSPSSLPFLERTRERCSHRTRWQIVGKAAAERAGQAEFSLGAPGNDAFEGFLDTGRRPEARRATVEVTTIDHVWNELGRPAVSVIKSDTEGAELRVLQGARQCIEACRPAILIEWNATNLKPYGVNVQDLALLSAELDVSIFSMPDLVPIEDPVALVLKTHQTENFLLLPRR